MAGSYLRREIRAVLRQFARLIKRIKILEYTAPATIKIGADTIVLPAEEVNMDDGQASGRP